MVIPIDHRWPLQRHKCKRLRVGSSQVREMMEIAELAELSFSNFPSLIAPKWCGTNPLRIIWEVRHDATETLSFSDST